MRADSDNVDSPRSTCIDDPPAIPTVTNAASPGQRAVGRWVSMSSSMSDTLKRTVSVAPPWVYATSQYHPVSVTSIDRVVASVLHR